MMRRTFRFTALLFAVLLVGLPLRSQAQDLQIGYTDSERILVNMPEYQDVQQQLQQYAQTQQQELQQQLQTFQQDVQQFQQEQSLLSEEKRQERQQQLQQQQQQIQQARQQQQQEIMQREQELMNPVITKLQSAIDEVAQNRNLDMVVESRAMLFVSENSDYVVDITPAVADNLGLEPPEGNGEGVDLPASGASN